MAKEGKERRGGRRDRKRTEEREMVRQRKGHMGVRGAQETGTE